MHLDLAACRALLDELRYTRDDRNYPDTRRQGRFAAGWRDAAEKGRIYGAKSMEALTWANLGNRLGARFGQATADDIDETYRCFAEAYLHDRR